MILYSSVYKNIKFRKLGPVEKSSPRRTEWNTSVSPLSGDGHVWTVRDNMVGQKEEVEVDRRSGLKRSSTRGRRRRN